MRVPFAVVIADYPHIIAPGAHLLHRSDFGLVRNRQTIVHMATLPPGESPTQTQYPARTVVRSTAAAAIPTAGLLPVLIEHLGEQLAAVVFVVLVVGNAIITRILASPSVEAALRRTVPLLAAAPHIPKHREDTTK